MTKKMIITGKTGDNIHSKIKQVFVLYLII
jgi:hypothetical protein